MKTRFFSFRRFCGIAAIAAAVVCGVCVGVTGVFAQSMGVHDAPAPVASPIAPQSAQDTNAAAAAIAGGYVKSAIPDIITDIADSILRFFHIEKTGNSWERLILAAGVIVCFYLLRRIVLPRVFRFFRKIARRTSWTFDDKIISAVEKPAAFFVMLLGVYIAVRTFQYTREVAGVVNSSAMLLFSIAFFWLLLRMLNVMLEYLHVRAARLDSGTAAFMPWIRKAAVTIFSIVGVLTIAQAMGLPVQTFIAGLGIGGLALALASQDTVANIFGAVVVAVDQPFRIGETVQLAGHTGTVEDIGIRSMKLRRSDKALVVIPNKTVASESIINLSKFTNRRVEQILGFTYDSTPGQMEDIVNDLRAIITASPDVLADSMQVYFRDFSASSLDLFVVYVTKEPDYAKHMELRQRINLAFMRAAQARGLSFAFPTQTIDLAPSAAKVLGKSQ